MHARDHQLQTDVIDEIRRESAIDGSRIGVAVTDGVATLHGALASLTMVDAAIEATIRVPGIRAVANCVTFQCSGSLRRTDTDIASDAAAALQRGGCIPSIKASVREGEVRLQGLADCEYQRDKAASALANASPRIAGVNRIINDVVVSQPVAMPRVLEARARWARSRP
jgi:osmotically-inducible protein OsmY